MTDIRVIFVLPIDATDESDASEIMTQAYESCKQLVDNILWAKESELITKKFNKLDYIVFESFEGKDFNKLIESKCARVVGPLAVSVCLMEGKPIPSFQWPILNVAMYGCQVTCSQISKSAKEVIRNKVQLMGGLYTGNFTSSVTHLICDGTKSEKYMLAAERGVKLMLPNWINHIFEASKLSNVNVNDTQILKKYKCPIFHKLTICSTGITNSKEKAKLSEIISSNGGKMVAKLNLAETDVLICHGSTSDKYKAARKTRLPCVTLNWIFHSVEKGFALPHEKYYVKTVTSTPTKEGENIDPNFSTISSIGTTCIQRSMINETANISQMSIADTVAGTTRSSNKRKASDDLVEKIDIKKVKNAGHFLDGCSIFVTGFSVERRDKLNKIVNLSGATRYDNFSDRITHIIVGDSAGSEVTTIKAMGIPCALVSVQWLLDSVEQRRPAKEDRYLITYTDLDEDGEREKIGSPLSKKALKLLKNFNIPSSNQEDVTVVPEPVGDCDDALTQQYLKHISLDKDEEDTLAMLLKNQDGTTSSKKTSPTEEFLRTRPLQYKNNITHEDNNQTLEFKPHETSTQVSQVTSDMSENTDVLPIFRSHNFLLDGFDIEDTEAYKEYIIGVGGTVVDNNFKGVVDYAVVPIFNQLENLPAVQEVVNNLWIIQSIEEECACDIQYYHRPMALPSSTPLKNCVVTISVYTGQERHFLKSVIESLGGIFQEQFSRKNIVAKNVLASTHLISPEASGKKYDAALKWDLPVVNKDWLLECAKSGIKIGVEHFLISANKALDSYSLHNDFKEIKTPSNDNGQNDGRKGFKTTPKQNNYEPENKADADKNNLNHEKASVFTPIGVKTVNDDTIKTPLHQIYSLNRQDTPETCSQVTPINKILQDAINDKVLPTPSPKTYYPWDPKTPDTPIGAFIRPNPSPRLRKEMQKYINSFPEFVPPKRRLSTPLSELKKRLRDKVMGRGEYSQNTQDDAGPSLKEPFQDFHEETKKVRKESEDLNFEGYEHTEKVEEEPLIENVVVHQKLQELQQMVMANGSASATRRSSRMFEASTNPPGSDVILY